MCVHMPEKVFDGNLFTQLAHFFHTQGFHVMNILMMNATTQENSNKH